MTDSIRAELEVLRTRAACEESRRLAALERGDRQTADDAATELSRLYARACELERTAAA